MTFIIKILVAISYIFYTYDIYEDMHKKEFGNVLILFLFMLNCIILLFN